MWIEWNYGFLKFEFISIAMIIVIILCLVAVVFAGFEFN